MSSVSLLSSGLDVQTIVDQLIQLERTPITNLEKQTSTLQNKVKAFQSYNTKLSTLLDKLNNVLFKDETAPLSIPSGFLQRLARSAFAARTASSSDESSLTVTADKGAPVGSYGVTVSSLARAKTAASSNFADTTSTTTGTGTLTIQVGAKDPVTITIDATNNTLEGVRDAINNADAGVNAAIMNDGSSSPYRLLITANDTGTANAFTVTDNLSGGQALNLAETQAAVDAQFTVNGISLTKSSNTVSDVISGVSFTLKSTTDAPVQIRVGKDTDSTVSSIKEMVDAYNEVNSFANSQFHYDTSTKTAGVLAGDITLRNTLSDLRDILTGEVTNKYTNLHYMGEVGLKYNSDGSLSLDEAKLRNALDSNLTEVAALFLGEGTAGSAATVTASDARVTYASKTTATQPGTYAIEITSLAQRASLVGGQAVDTLGQNETLTITYGGKQTMVDLLSGDSLSTVLSKINSALAANGVGASAGDDGTGKIAITTTGYGSGESVTVVSSVDSMPGSTGFGTSPLTATGADIAGTINGNVAIGSGLTLTGASGNPEEGLSLQIGQTTTGSYGTVTVTSASTGDAGSSILVNLRTMLTSITDSLSGPVYAATDGLNNTIKGLQDRISEYEDRLEVRRQQLTDEYSRADEALKMLTLLQSQLSSQLDSLSKVNG